MKAKLNLVLAALISIFSAHAQSQLEETLFYETFANVKGDPVNHVTADMAQFDNPNGWILNNVYAGDNCIYLKEGSSITFPAIKDIIGNATFEIQGEPWYIEPNGDDENFDWEAYEKEMMKAGTYHATIENGELSTSEFDYKMAMGGAPFIFGVSSDTRLTIHADGLLKIRAIYIGYGSKQFWTYGKVAGYDPAAGIYYEPFDLTITPSNSTSGYGDDGTHNITVYTLDGTKPTRTSPRMTGPIHIDKSTKVTVGTIFGNGCFYIDESQDYEIQGASSGAIPESTFEITVDKPGVLKSKILEIDADEIKGLVLHGKMNGEDLAYVNSGSGRMGKLTYLNIADVTFDYDGTAYGKMVFAPEGGMGTVYTYTFYLSETNYEEGVPTGGPGTVATACYRNNLAGAFAKHPSLELIVLPDFMTSIGEWAFYNCKTLLQVKHSGKLTEIGNQSFYNCNLLSNIDLSSVEKVGAQCLQYSDLRGEIDLSVAKEIGDYSFSDTKLTSIKFGSPEYIGNNAFSGTLLKKLDLPNPPDTIPERAFACYDSRTYENTLKTVNLGEGVRYLGAYAFGEGVEDMTFPSTLEEVEENALSKKVVSKIEAEDGIKYVGKIAYAAADTRSSYTVKEGTVSIADGAFSFNYVNNCSQIEEVNIPNSLEIIGKNAFASTGLKRTPAMPNVKKIKDGAFAYCNNLGRAVLPESVEYIGGSIFTSCNSLWYIEYNAVDAKHNFSIDFPKVEKIVIGDKVRRIPTGLFTRNSNITEVTLPASVEIIEESAFEDCKSLEYVRLSDNVMSIGDHAFAYCENLGDFHWPANLKSVGFSAFRSCSSLKTISLPEGMETVGYGAFDDCSGVESLYIASTIGEFGYGAFVFRNPGKEITITATAAIPQEIDWTWSDYYMGTPTIKVPAASLEAYKSHPSWNGSNYKKDNLIIPIEEISASKTTSETTFAGIDGNTDLGDTVVGNVYVTVGEDDGYDDSDGSIFLNSTMDEDYMDVIGGMAPGESDLANRFNGLVVKVPNGTGKVTINCLTLGSKRMAVKIGEGEPQIYAMDSKGDITVDYDVEEDSYVYIYASEASLQQLARRPRAKAVASDNCIKIYSVTVNPINTGVDGIESDIEGESTIVEYYSIDGSRVNNPTWGIYIVRRADGTSSKIMIK